MKCLKGIQASSGIAIGKAVLLKKNEIAVSLEPISDTDAENEIQRYEDAVALTKVQINQLVALTTKKLGEEKAAIFVAHLDILADPSLEDSVHAKIRDEHKNAEWALDESTKEICDLFNAIDDAYMRERAADVVDVCTRIMYALKGIEIVSLSNLPEEAIVVAKDLTPSDTAAMDLGMVLGFATDLGGKTSHTSIMARSLFIPAVVGTGNVFENVKNNDMLILDAVNAQIIINPDDATIQEYRQKQQQLAAEQESLRQILTLPTVTTDGHCVELCANIGSPNDVDSALNNGAMGVGLYRTEFLYMDNSHFPTEEEQFNAYKEVAERMNPHSVIIRTLDIGGDKDLPYYSFKKEDNPFLGWRAIRICLDRTDIFKTQLRAILRASVFGKIRIMYPMIISLTELRAANEVLAACKNELTAEGIPFDPAIETGIMIETPASVVICDLLAKEADFFSIGTNDLTQYTLAVDRGNETITKLYNSFHPAVIRSIKAVIDASHKAGKWTGMCGEFAGDEKAAKLLLGLGLDEFSMSAASLLKVKSIIRGISYEDAKKAADHVLTLATTEEIEDFIQ